MAHFDQKRSPQKRDSDAAGSRQPIPSPLRNAGHSDATAPLAEGRSFSTERETEIMQMQRAIGNQAVRQLQRNEANATGMPERLKAGVESLSGLRLDGVKVHYNSPSPAQIGALAYTQGTDIHIGPGQEEHLPHEAWHVVQQAQGRVRPTLQLKGAAINDDARLEKEADEMGSRAARSGAEGAVQLKAAEGNRSQVKQLVRNKNASPVLANGRDLLKDADAILAGGQREALEEPSSNPKFLDTTYDDIGDNLILDIDMLYEENLQRAIEHDSFFTASIKRIVDIIHGNLEIGSIDPESANLKADRIDGILKQINQTLGASDDDKVTLEKLIKSNWTLDTSSIQGEDGKEKQRMTTGYVKLLKMLETQLPYFGGSEEYDHNETGDFEYWIYHMSSLTKDPDRQYKASTPEAGLTKPLLDYRTHKDGLVPHRNQRNLGTGIVELPWDELPKNFQSMISGNFSERLELFKAEMFSTPFQEFFGDGQDKQAGEFWDNAGKPERRDYTTRLPWSKAPELIPDVQESLEKSSSARKEEEGPLVRQETELLQKQRDLSEEESDLYRQNDREKYRENLDKQIQTIEELHQVKTRLRQNRRQRHENEETGQELDRLKALREKKSALKLRLEQLDPSDSLQKIDYDYDKFWLGQTEKELQHTENLLKSSEPMRKYAANKDWEELPDVFKRPIAEEMAGKSQKWKSLLKIEENFKNKDIKALWNGSDEEARKIIYGDIMRLPWSDAHKDQYQYNQQFPEDHDKQLSYELLSYLAPLNVAGVMGNILETPEQARKRYDDELGKKFKGNNYNVFNHVSGEEELNKDKILDEFQKKHQDWYDSAKKNHKPIIGGISGHTLGYLNLYEDALTKAEGGRVENIVDKEPDKYPTMEVLRAAMLGALVGDKRHHSYDEVMTASHMMPTHDRQQTLKYKHPDSYEDVLLSEQSNIKQAAEYATRATAGSVKDPEENTVLSRLMKKEEKDDKPLKDAVLKYLQNGLKQDSASDLKEELKKRAESGVEKAFQ